MVSKAIDISPYPNVIFDSRTAKRVYKEFSYYRSESFKVPAGYIAVVEMTAHKDYIPALTFTAIRTPADSNSGHCYAAAGVGKRYRRWKCSQSLGSTEASGGSGQPTEITPYNKSVVRWGWDFINEEIVEFEYITRPGTYYLIADKCNNLQIEDCNNPTIIEVTLIPVNHIPELHLSCCDPCDTDGETQGSA